MPPPLRTNIRCNSSAWWSPGVRQMEKSTGRLLPVFALPRTSTAAPSANSAGWSRCRCVCDAVGERLLLVALDPDALALLAEDDGGAGVLAHRQHAAGRDAGVLQQVQRDEAVVGRGLGVIEDLAQAAARWAGRSRWETSLHAASVRPVASSTADSHLQHGRGRRRTLRCRRTPAMSSLRQGVASGLEAGEHFLEL